MRWLKSASSARHYPGFDCRWAGSGGPFIGRGPVCCGLARPGSGHPGARSPSTSTSPAGSRLEAGPCWRSQQTHRSRGHVIAGWGLSGFRQAPQFLNPGPPGDHGRRRSPQLRTCWWWPMVSPPSIGVRSRGCAEHSRSYAHHQHYSRTPTSRQLWSDPALKGGTAVSSPPAPDQNAAVLPER